MDTIVLIVMIVVGILFLIISLVLSAREKKTETGAAEKEPDMEAYKKELEDEMNRLLDSCTQTAQKKLEASAKETLDARVEEAKREIEVTINEAKAYVETLLETARTKMEDCVKQTQENSNGIADELKQRIEEMEKNDIAQLKQDAENVRGEIVERQKETEMLYTLVNDKQNQLIESIEQEQQRAQALSDTVETVQARAQSLSDLSFSQAEPQTAEAVPAHTDEQTESQQTESQQLESPQTESSQPTVEAAEELPQKEEIEESAQIKVSAEQTGKALQTEETAKQTEGEQIQDLLQIAETEEQAEEVQIGDLLQVAETEEQVEEMQIEDLLQVAETEEQTEEVQPEDLLQIKAGETAQAEESAEAQQLSAEKEYAESTAFDEVRPRSRKRKKKHFLQRTEETDASGVDESDLTKPIDREEIRDALHAQPHKAMEALAARIGRKKKKSAVGVQETQPEPETETEIDIDEVVVADVEELDSIATETVKEALQEVLDEDEGLLDYAETTWEQENTDSAQEAQEEAVPEEIEREEAAPEEAAQEETAQEEAKQEEKEEKREGKRRGARRRKKSVVWELSGKEQKDETPAAAEAEEAPQEESLPADMIIEDEPNKMLHAVRSSGTVSTEADVEMRANVLRMYDNGHSSMEIAEALKLGIGEVRMIIDLYSRRER